MTTRVAIFVDTQNVYYTVREAYGKHFDYRRFWAKATVNREVVAARCYAIDKGDAKQREFQNILRSIGFEVGSSPSSSVRMAPPKATGTWASPSMPSNTPRRWMWWCWSPAMATSIC